MQCADEGVRVVSCKSNKDEKEKEREWKVIGNWRNL